MSNGPKRVLTGVKPTGTPHIGNYFGAIKPAIDLAQSHESYLFLADLHALTIRPKPDQLVHDTYSVSAAWIALGTDPSKTVFYRQSDIPEIPFIAWILSCNLPLGYLNRAHSFKDVQQKGTSRDDVLHGLYSYPVLMASDILTFDVDLVPVGKDQKQHLEIAQEIARKFNNYYGQTEELLKVPEAQIDEQVMTIPGLDGRKMSKSYDNTLTPFMDGKMLKKAVKKITTTSDEYGSPLPTDNDVILDLIKLLAPDKHSKLTNSYKTGRKNPDIDETTLGDPQENFFGWGDAKKALIEAAETRFAEANQEYNRLMSDKAELENLLQKGAIKARETAQKVAKRVAEAVGLTTQFVP